MDRRGGLGVYKKKNGRPVFTRLNCIDCGTHGDCGGWTVFCHTHLNLSHSQRPGQTKPQEKVPALERWDGAALLVGEKTGNTCGGLDTGRDGRPAERPGTRIPGPRPSLTLPVPTDTSLSATLGQRSGAEGRAADISAELSYRKQPGHRVRDGGSERKERWMFSSMAEAFCGLVMLT